MWTPDSPVGSWIWALQTAGGGTVTVLSGALGRNQAFKRNTTPEATCDIGIAHDDAYALHAALEAGGNGGLPVLRCFRIEQLADESVVAVCRFAGPILPVEDSVGDNGAVAVTARGAFEYLEGRFVGEPPDPLWVRDLVDAGDIAVELIDEQNDAQNTFIEIGDIEETTFRTVEYESKRVADAIVELAGLQDGFDFEVVPLADAQGQGVTLGRFNIHAQQGQVADKAKFGYGDGTLDNCNDAHRTTMRPVNRVRVFGDEGMSGEAEDFTSQDKYGIWAETDSMSDAVDQDALDSRAAELLRPAPVRVITFKPNAEAENCPAVWGDYWLGDVVEVSVRDGAFAYDGEPRVESIGIDIDDDGYESEHSITIEAE